MRRVILPLPRELDGDLWLSPIGAQAAPAARRLGHAHAELELNLVVRGSGAYLIDGRRVALRPRSLVWLFPAQHHLMLDDAPDLEMWIGVFRPRLLRAACRSAGSRTLARQRVETPLQKRLAAEAAARLERLFEEVAESRGRPDAFNAGLAFAALAAWGLFSDADEAGPGTDVHPAVERAARLLREEPGGELNLAGLARRAGLSPARLSRLFKQQTGVSLTQYRNRFRLERFLELYGEGQRRSMLQAALEAGFGSYPQFHRVFRARMGVGPRGYRRKKDSNQ
ncbi:MAG: AraC family transcriptional regulator [Planctomycetota bacterium]|nr:AraC family transcriptional regulator [Planctomycetota bacterium]